MKPQPRSLFSEYTPVRGRGWLRWPMQLLTGLLTILFFIAVLLIVTGIRAIAWATPWVLIGYVGLVLGAAVGGLPAWLIAGVNGARWGGLIAGTLAWAVLGGLYGAKIGWQRWWGQHYD